MPAESRDVTRVITTASSALIDCRVGRAPTDAARSATRCSETREHDRRGRRVLPSSAASVVVPAHGDDLAWAGDGRGGRCRPERGSARSLSTGGPAGSDVASTSVSRRAMVQLAEQIVYVDDGVGVDSNGEPLAIGAALVHPPWTDLGAPDATVDGGRPDEPPKFVPDARYSGPPRRAPPPGRRGLGQLALLELSSFPAARVVVALRQS